MDEGIDVASLRRLRQQLPSLDNRRRLSELPVAVAAGASWPRVRRAARQQQTELRLLGRMPVAASATRPRFIERGALA